MASIFVAEMRRRFCQRLRRRRLSSRH